MVLSWKLFFYSYRFLPEKYSFNPNIFVPRMAFKTSLFISKKSFLKTRRTFSIKGPIIIDSEGFKSHSHFNAQILGGSSQVFDVHKIEETKQLDLYLLNVS